MAMNLLPLHDRKSRRLVGRNLVSGRPGGRSGVRPQRTTMTRMTPKPATVKMILSRAAPLWTLRYEYRPDTFRVSSLSAARITYAG